MKKIMFVILVVIFLYSSLQAEGVKCGVVLGGNHAVAIQYDALYFVPGIMVGAALGGEITDFMSLEINLLYTHRNIGKRELPIGSYTTFVSDTIGYRAYVEVHMLSKWSLPIFKEVKSYLIAGVIPKALLNESYKYVETGEVFEISNIPSILSRLGMLFSIGLGSSISIGEQSLDIRVTFDTEFFKYMNYNSEYTNDYSATLVFTYFL